MGKLLPVHFPQGFQQLPADGQDLADVVIGDGVPLLEMLQGPRGADPGAAACQPLPVLLIQAAGSPG